jgi:hypothetical protein
MSARLVNRFATKKPTLCAVCHRYAVWLGYAPNRQPIVWLCNDNGCHAAARKVYAMPGQILEDYEIGAALEAGDLAGSYLDEIGITDLAKLDAWQWREFLRRIVVGFEQSMRRKILNDEPPFQEQHQ